MSLTLAGLTLAVIAGAVIAASSREARAGLIGLALALGLGPFLADPLPDAAVLGSRVVSGILVVYLLRTVAIGGSSHSGGTSNQRGASLGLGSRIGWPAESVLALGATIAGVAIATGLSTAAPGGVRGSEVTDPFGTLTPSALALAAGLASVVIGMAPAFLGRHALRTTLGLLLAVQGVVLARTGIAGPPGELEQLGIAGLLLAVGAAGALLIVAEARGRRDAPLPARR